MTYVDELGSIPGVEERPGCLLEADNGRKAEDVDADFKELVDDLAGCSENIYGRFGDALRRR